VDSNSYHPGCKLRVHTKGEMSRAIRPGRCQQTWAVGSVESSEISASPFLRPTVQLQPLPLYFLPHFSCATRRPGLQPDMCYRCTNQLGDLYENDLTKHSLDVRTLSFIKLCNRIFIRGGKGSEGWEAFHVPSQSWSCELPLVTLLAALSLSMCHTLTVPVQGALQSQRTVFGRSGVRYTTGHADSSHSFTSPRGPDRLWGPHSLLSMGTGGQKGRGVKLTIHLKLVPRSRIPASIHPLSHTPSWRTA
jgi:hypothetical protein